VGELALVRRLLGARIRADWQYRTSFVLFLLSQTLVAGLDLAAIGVLFTQIDALAGWSVGEVALLYAVAGLGFGFADVLVSQVEEAATYIRLGTFDNLLLRPVGTLTQLCAAEFSVRRIGRSLQPAVVLVVALARLDIAWTPVKLVLLPLAIVSGAVIFGAIWVLTASISFWTVETQEVANSFTYGGSTLSHYPLDVLGGWLRRVVVFVLPLAFVGYLPVAYLLDKDPGIGLSRDLAFLAPVVAVALAALARLQWSNAVRHYRSTGS
jgi:ABC-2 type transport system permease protein